MSSTTTPRTNLLAARTLITSKATYTLPPTYTPSDTSSIASTSSTAKKSLLKSFTQKYAVNSSDSSSTKSTEDKGKDGLATAERKIRNEARASYFSTLK